MRYIFLFFFLSSITFCFSQKKHKDGPYKTYHKNGQLKIEGHYRKNKKIGAWREYYNNGQLLKVFSYNNKGESTGFAESYYRSGKLMGKKTPVKQGTINQHFFEDTGNILYEHYIEKPKEKNSNSVGFYKQNYENGKRNIEVNLINNQNEGVWHKYYETGEKHWEINYFKGYKQGDYKEYFKNGNLKLEGFHLAGLKNGTEKRYNDDGSLLYEGKYLKDVLDGEWINYNSKTGEKKTFKYKKGKLKGKSNMKPSLVPYWAFEEVPVYPGCEKVLGMIGQKNCMSSKISAFVNQKFNSSIAKSLDLEGRQRIYIIFKIDKTGTVTGVRARASHPKLEEEAIKVIKTLPKMKPGMQRGKAVTVPYSLPIVFMVQKKVTPNINNRNRNPSYKPNNY